MINELDRVVYDKENVMVLEIVLFLIVAGVSLVIVAMWVLPKWKRNLVNSENLGNDPSMNCGHVKDSYVISFSSVLASLALTQEIWIPYLTEFRENILGKLNCSV